MSRGCSPGLELLELPGGSNVQTCHGDKALLSKWVWMQGDFNTSCCTSVGTAGGTQRRCPGFQLALQGPTGRAGIATWGKEIWVASFCLTGQGILSERGIGRLSNRAYPPSGRQKGQRDTPHFTRKEFICGSASPCNCF